MSKHDREAVAVLVCDGGRAVAATVQASAPIRGDSAIDLEQAHRAARLAAVKLAESRGWQVSKHGAPVRDLCPSCAVKAAAAAPNCAVKMPTAAAEAKP